IDFACCSLRAGIRLTCSVPFRLRSALRPPLFPYTTLFRSVRIFANQSADGKAPPHGETQVPRRRKSAPHPHFLPRPFPSNTEGPSEKNRSKSLKDLPLPSLGGNHPGLTGKPDYSGGPGRDSSLSAPICSSFFLIALRLGFPSPTTSPSITTTGYQSSSSITRRENSASRSPSGPWMST